MSSYGGYSYWRCCGGCRRSGFVSVVVAVGGVVVAVHGISVAAGGVGGIAVPARGFSMLLRLLSSVSSHCLTRVACERCRCNRYCIFLVGLALAVALLILLAECGRAEPRSISRGGFTGRGSFTKRRTPPPRLERDAWSMVK